jgi:hypothetical protein
MWCIIAVVIPFFRCICIVAKRACWLHHVCPSVCPHVFVCLPLAGFLWNLILGIVWKSVDRLQILLKVYILDTLHKDLRMFYCCWWQKFATKAFLCIIQYFYAADHDIQLSNTHNALLHFHCTNGCANVSEFMLYDLFCSVHECNAHLFHTIL